MGFLASALGALGGGGGLGALLTGGGAVAGALGQSRAARTSTQQQRTSGTSSSTTRSRRVMTPEQQALMGPLAQQALGMLTNPGAGLEPIALAQRGAVNKAYGAVPGAIADRMVSTGGGRSGKLGRAMRESEIARAGALAGADSNISRLMLDRQDAGASLAERLLGMTFEQEGGTTGAQTGDMNGESVMPGSMAAGGLGGGLETLSALSMLARMLGGK